MAPVIWGLDLSEMQWAKFKSSYMWSNQYHLRRTKFIVYQLAMIMCVVSESLGTDVLSSYVDEQKNIEGLSSVNGSRLTVKNNDIVGSFSYNIFVGVYVATIFGAAFFFDLFWPERHESKAVRVAWKACSILACCFALSSAVLLTIILATKKAVLVGTVSKVRIVLNPPLSYKHSAESIASVVLIWLGWVATCGSTGLMFSSINHVEKYGSAKAGHLRTGEDESKPSNKTTSPAAGESLKDAESEKDSEEV